MNHPARMIQDVWKYRKALQAHAQAMREMSAELQIAQELPCAPAIGVHRPYCECGVDGNEGEKK